MRMSKPKYTRDDPRAESHNAKRIDHAHTMPVAQIPYRICRQCADLLANTTAIGQIR